jgi:hypothetical protein
MTRPLLASTLLLALLTACVPVPAPTPTVVAVQPSTTFTPLPTEPPPTDTPAPTATSTASPSPPPATPTRAATPSVAPSETPPPTPDLDPDGDGIKSKHELRLGTDPDTSQSWRDSAFLKTALSTLKLNGIFVRNYFQHVPAKANPGQTHAETSALWSGDSSELTVFVRDNLAHHGAEAWAVDVQWNIRGNKVRGRSLPVVRLADGYWYLSSQPSDLGRVYGPFEKLESLAGWFEPRWERIVGVDASGNELPVIER